MLSGLRHYEGRLALLKYLPETLKTRTALKSPVALQESKLLQIVARNADTEYGRTHAFAEVRSVKDYQRRVPINTFETLRPLVARIAAGEHNVLTASAPLMFARTSGTAGEPKLIPVTPEFRDEYHSRIWFVNLICRYPAIVNTKAILSIVGSAVEDHTQSGVPIGSISGHIYQNQRPSVLKRYTLPYDVLTIKDFDAKYYTILRIAAEVGVRLIVTPNPSTVILLAQKADEYQEEIIADIADGTLSKRVDVEPDLRVRIEAGLTANRARARELGRISSRADGHLRPAHIWPGLQAISCWVNGSARLYLDELRELYGNVPLHSMGYLASEGRGSLPFAWSGYDVLAVHSHFFEFIPEEAREEADPPVLTIADLEVGHRYFVLFTTSAGLYRYDIDDVITVTGWYLGTPVIEFAYKGANVHSFTGEKITEEQVALAVSEAVGETGARIGTSCVVPEYGRPPRYRLLVEYARTAPPEADAALARAFDAALANLNVEYRGKRTSGRLGPVCVDRLLPGSYAEYRRERARSGRSDAQFKLPALNPGKDFADFLDRTNRLEPDVNRAEAVA